MDTIVNHKFEMKDFFQVSWTENPPALGKSQRHKNAGIQNAIAWGSCPGQAIAVRRAAQERRSKQTWPSDARQHGEREKVQTIIRRSQRRHPKKPSFLFAGTGGAR
jgi:hypothetical protein